MDLTNDNFNDSDNNNDNDGDWRRWRRRSPAERWLLLEALAALMLGRIAIRWLRFKRVAAFLGLAPQPRAIEDVAWENSASRVTTHHAERIAKVGWAVRTAAARIPGGATCLVRTLAGATLLQIRSIPCTLVLGIARDRDKNKLEEGIVAHAWLIAGGVILTGAESHGRFTTISAFVAAPAARTERVPA